MSSKDKDTSSKIRKFLKSGKINPSSRERTLRHEIELELRPELPAAHRCKNLKELGDNHLHNYNLDESSITRLWDLTKDLIVPNKSAEYRQTALTFYKKLIHTQYKNLTLMREHFFLVIQNHDVHEDLKHRLELLDTLTKNGKDITNFEEKIGRFMLQWIPAITEANLLPPYLAMLINLIKCNAALLDNDIVVGIVQNACHLSCTVENDDIGLQCLMILESVTCYTIFPSDPLPQCVVTLCRTVNHSPYCQASWKIMKNLLGTELGFYAMKMMCNILNDRSLYDDQQLLRGAVFHLYMNVFAANKVSQESPMLSACTVLTSFLNALESRQVNVTYEVILSVRKVINKYKTELSEIIWDRICDILFAIVDNIEYFERNNYNKEHIYHLKLHFHENIDTIEKLLQDEKTVVLANIDRIYDLIERVSEARPESSVLQLIEYRSTKVTATRPQWLQILHEFVRRFYNMPITSVRLKTIQSLMRIMELNRFSYEEEILERVVIPHFAQIPHEPDMQIRVAVVRSLVEFAAHCDTKRCGELLDILEKIINRPFEHHGEGNVVIKSEADVMDISVAVDGLIDVFVIKLYRCPSSHAIKIFNILVGHLELHYDRPKIFEAANIVRYKIFNWMLKARSNASYHIGYPDPTNNDAYKFSPYLGIDSSLPLSGMAHHHQRAQISTQSAAYEIVPAAHYTTISIRRACKIIVKSLENDRDLQVFQLVIKELPKVLQNKALIQGNDIEALASALFKICNPAYKPSSDEFHALIVPAIAALVIYHDSIQPTHQCNIISILTKGLHMFAISGVADVCINAMTTMVLEMPEMLMRTLPEILLEMSKMSDTTTVAIPVLEFLSILSRSSNHLFTNFTTKQYAYVFAISLPYTKSYRYDHYTVSLAHHVIAGWFLKSKLELRKNFVTYIISSIKSNLNEDSSNRKRSTSLTERGSRNTTAQRTDADMRSLKYELDNLKNFHEELAETCIDFLARHTFSPCSALPKRLPAAEYLLKDGLSQTWLIGHNLVTITTSGCPSAPVRNGLCDRCAQLGKSSNLLAKSDTSGTTPVSPEVNALQGGGGHTLTAAGVADRRYTKVSLQHSSGNESAGSTDLTSSSSSTSAVPSTQRQTSNSSSASMEALSRRGSNPDNTGDGPTTAVGGSTTSLLGNSLSTTSISASPTQQLQPVQQQTCIRSCSGWAEIFIRRPTGNVSWIMRIQNPIANDCFGQDLPFSNIVSLFLPTTHGGVFGPDFVQSALSGEDAPVAIVPVNTESILPAVNSSRESLASVNAMEDRRKAVAKVRALQRQEEISSTASTAAIDIPTKATSKRGKDALAGSVSDGEVEEEIMAFDDGQGRARNPVRRVNSSPEMSSSWRLSFLASKPAPLSQEILKSDLTQTDDTSGAADTQHQPPQPHQQQKKKSVQYTKDMRVSCEAIPEEIAGSTPPQANTDKAAADSTTPKLLETGNVLPPKQHSADDVTETAGGQPVQQSASATSLKSHVVDKVATKPPLSPAPVPPLSPRLDKHIHAQRIATFSPHPGLAKSSSSGGGGANAAGIMGGAASGINFGTAGDYNNGDMMRGRSKTISVVREVNGKPRPPTANFTRTFPGPKPSLNTKLCINPSFLMLQLYNTGQLQATDEPIKVPPEESNAIGLLDLVPPYETHKIGVLYVGQGQCNNLVEILRNSHGSTRYMEFLRNIGDLISLTQTEQDNLFVCLDRGGADGKFTYVWKDDIVQVTFHVATLMPTNLEKDPNCNEKKKHIGNDFVSIIYNESGENYNLNTISGQFSHACVIVEPLELNTNRIYVKARQEISKFVCHSEPKIVSDRSAPLLARQLALHANLATHVYQSMQKNKPIPYASNWLERLRNIKRLRSKLDSQNKHHQSGNFNADIDDQGDSGKRQNINRDFTKYT